MLLVHKFVFMGDNNQKQGWRRMREEREGKTPTATFLLCWEVTTNF